MSFAGGKQLPTRETTEEDTYLGRLIGTDVTGQKVDYVMDNPFVKTVYHGKIPGTGVATGATEVALYNYSYEWVAKDVVQDEQPREAMTTTGLLGAPSEIWSKSAGDVGEAEWWRGYKVSFPWFG